MPFAKTCFSPTRMLIAASLCVGSVASFPTPAVAACQAGQPGCVLPVGEAPPPVARTAPPVVVDERGGFGLGWLAVLAVLAALAALLLFVLDDDEEDLPTSP